MNVIRLLNLLAVLLITIPQLFSSHTMDGTDDAFLNKMRDRLHQIRMKNRPSQGILKGTYHKKNKQSSEQKNCGDSNSACSYGGAKKEDCNTCEGTNQERTSNASKHANCKSCKTKKTKCASCESMEGKCTSCKATKTKCASCESMNGKCTSCKAEKMKCASCESMKGKCTSCKAKKMKCASCESMKGKSTSCKAKKMKCASCQKNDGYSNKTAGCTMNLTKGCAHCSAGYTKACICKGTPGPCNCSPCKPQNVPKGRLKY